MTTHEFIPYGRHTITDEDIAAVVDVLRSDWLTQGPAVPSFEQALADYCGAAHAVAVNSATSALHIACLALGLQPGGLVWTSPISFVASANCALYCGAEVDFVDIDPDTYNLCPDALERKLILAEASGRLPDIVIPVHLCGLPCDMQRIHALSQRFGFRIIEDASHAIGSHYAGKTTGACTFSDITVFSLHPVKIITAAEGGIALTQDPNVAEAMRRLRSHGIVREAREWKLQPAEAWHYEQQTLGFNYRLTDLQAALGESQLKRIDDIVTERNRLASHYTELFNSTNIRTQRFTKLDTCRSSFHLYVIRISSQTGQRSRSDVFNALRAQNIGVQLHYIPIYRHPFHSVRYPNAITTFPEAENYYNEAITLPLYPGMTNAQQQRIASSVIEAIGG
jgi:UDP-4-amino-4,6-dideoxy-N-acetyl-beta-L-altrosamine transaminase